MWSLKDWAHLSLNVWAQFQPTSKMCSNNECNWFLKITEFGMKWYISERWVVFLSYSDKFLKGIYGKGWESSIFFFVIADFSGESSFYNISLRYDNILLSSDFVGTIPYLFVFPLEIKVYRSHFQSYLILDMGSLCLGNYVIQVVQGFL